LVHLARLEKNVGQLSQFDFGVDVSIDEYGTAGSGNVPGATLVEIAIGGLGYSFGVNDEKSAAFYETFGVDTDSATAFSHPINLGLPTGTWVRVQCHVTIWDGSNPGTVQVSFAPSGGPAMSVLSDSLQNVGPQSGAMATFRVGLATKDTAAWSAHFDNAVFDAQ
jgi:hypothetical protein